MSLSDDTSEDAIRELKIAAGTPPKELAGSIIHLLQEGKRVRLAAIGHQAVGQAVKAIPIVNQYCITQGYLVSILPFFRLMGVQDRDAPTGEESRTQERTVTMLSLIQISPQ